MKILLDLVFAISLIRRINVSNETIDEGIPNTFSQSISTFDLFFSFFFSLNSREVNTLAPFCRDDAGK